MIIRSIPLDSTRQCPGSNAVKKDDESESTVFSATFARPIEQTPPKYPKSAQRRDQEGWVDVSYVVQPDGAVTDPIVDDSSGITAF